MNRTCAAWLMAMAVVWSGPLAADEDEVPVNNGADTLVTPVTRPEIDEDRATLGLTDQGRIQEIALDDVPIEQVLALFARRANVNIVAGPGIAGTTVSANLRDVEWESALLAILDSVGLVMVERSPGIRTVISQEQYEAEMQRQRERRRAEAESQRDEPLTSAHIALHFTTTNEVLPVVQQMLVHSNATATAFASSNAIIVNETEGQVQRIRTMVEQIDIERPQVYVEVKFVELNDTKASDVGIDWQVLQGYSVGAAGVGYSYERTRTRMDQDAAVRARLDTRMDGNSTSTTDGATTTTSMTGRDQTLIDAVVQGRNFESFDLEDGTITTVPSRVREDVLSAVLSADAFALTLSALEQRAGVEVVSDPKIVVASGQTASIHVGRNEPNVVAVPTGDLGDRYAFSLDSQRPWIEIGVKLDVTPTVNTDDNITVRITPELSRKIGDKFVGEAGTSFPITQTRRIITEFNVPTGKTVAIGGLTTEEDRERVRRVPVLGSIPVIGKYLFSHRSTERIRDEVIMFVTVHKLETAAMDERAGLPSNAELIHPRLERHAGTARPAEAASEPAEVEMVPEAEGDDPASGDEEIPPAGLEVRSLFPALPPG